MPLRPAHNIHDVLNVLPFIYTCGWLRGKSAVCWRPILELTQDRGDSGSGKGCVRCEHCRSFLGGGVCPGVAALSHKTNKRALSCFCCSYSQGQDNSVSQTRGLESALPCPPSLDQLTRPDSSRQGRFPPPPAADCACAAAIPARHGRD